MRAEASAKAVNLLAQSRKFSLSSCIRSTANLSPRSTPQVFRRNIGFSSISSPNKTSTSFSQHIRYFSATRARDAVQVINPKQDEDGKDMVVDISARAAKVCH
jgi:hypothetical protein